MSIIKSLDRKKDWKILPESIINILPVSVSRSMFIIYLSMRPNWTRMEFYVVYANRARGAGCSSWEGWRGEKLKGEKHEGAHAKQEQREREREREREEGERNRQLCTRGWIFLWQYRRPVCIPTVGPQQSIDIRSILVATARIYMDWRETPRCSFSDGNEK